MTENGCLFVERLKTPIGTFVITHDGRQLCNAEFADQSERRALELTKYFPNASFKHIERPTMICQTLAAYFDGDVYGIDRLLVAILGTPFQQRAWKALRQVKPGTTRSYGAMARMLGNSRAARAVGRANGLNPISIVVPCHRLVGSTGDLVHYGGGLVRKRWLIDHENRNARATSRGQQVFES